MEEAAFLETFGPTLRRSTRLQRQNSDVPGVPPSETPAQYRRNREMIVEDSKRPVTWRDLYEKVISGRKGQSAQKRPYSQVEQTERDDHDGTEPFKKTLIVTLKLKSLVQDRQHQGEYIKKEPYPDRMTSISSSEDDTSFSEDDTSPSYSPSPSPSSYREASCSEQSSEHASSEAKSNASGRTPTPTSSRVTGTLPPKPSSHPAPLIAPTTIPTLQHPVNSAITLDQQKRTILRVALLSGASGHVPLRLRSCMSLSALFTSVSTASGLSGDGGSAIASVISATFDWKAETDIDKRIYIRRDLDDSFDIFLETIAEAPVWEQEGAKCGIAVAVVDSRQSA